LLKISKKIYLTALYAQGSVMNVSGYQNYQLFVGPDFKRTVNQRVCKQNKLLTDTFEPQSKTSFTGIKTKIAEDIYTNIDGLHDPYSEVMLMSKKKFKDFKAKAAACPNSDSMIRLMNKYQEHLFKPEKQMLDIFSKITKKTKINHPKDAKHLTFHAILQSLLPDARKQLKPEQLHTLDAMKKVSLEMSPESQAVLKPLFKQTRKEIADDTFRIQPTIEAFESLRKQIPENKLFNNLIEAAAQFPSSATSVNALIVKHAGKTHEEIAVAMLKPSLISIEHIRPKSKGGGSDANNYIAASTRMNNLRKSLSLPKLIRRYPKIPHYTQQYFDGLIEKVNKGGLSDIGATLPNVKETLKRESKGFLDVNIDKLSSHIRNENAQMNLRLENLVDFFANLSNRNKK